jgi:H+/Cl- antiporter ClcA
MKQYIARVQSPTFLLRLIIAGLMAAGFVVCILASDLAWDDAQKHPETSYLVYPFLLGVGILYTLFCVALVQAWRLLHLIDRQKVFTRQAVRTLTLIKWCAATIAGIVLFGMGVVIYIAYGEDDFTGFVTLAIVASTVCILISASAAIFESTLQRAVEVKKEHDLTV